MIKKTKIVATIGPSSDSPKTIARLYNLGLDVARLNFSHGTLDGHHKVIQKIRSIPGSEKRPLAILQDLQGPKIRVGILPDEGVDLIKGEVYKFASLEYAKDDDIPVQYPDLHKDLKTGDNILLADGTLEVSVEKIKDHHVYCKVIVGGKLTSKKGINMPNSDLKVDALTEQDLINLQFGLDHKLEFIAFSFVRNAKDLKPALDIIAGSDFRPKLIAKIEKPQALDNIDELLDAVDGIMVARGDLGVEMPLESVPHIQKKLILKANMAGKYVITATQMLKSMMENPYPTRAEVADVANAIIDGTDAVMLSDETASGHYPIESVDRLIKIAATTEENIDYYQEYFEDFTHEIDLAVARASISIAKSIDLPCIITFTASGRTANLLSKMRPHVPILALTPIAETLGPLSLMRGVYPIKIDFVENVEVMSYVSIRAAKELGLVKSGDKVVLLAGTHPGRPGFTNLVRVLEVI